MSETAEQKFIDQHRAFEQNGAGSSPEWIKSLRANAIHRFEENGFPTTRDEAWRFTSIKQVLENEFAFRSDGVSVSEQKFEANFLEPNGFRVAVINGKFSAEHSELTGLPEGVTVTSLAEAVGTHQELVSAYLAKRGPGDGNAFLALSTAFLRDGVFVHVAAGVDLPKPLELLFSGVAEGVVEHPRVLLIAGANSRLQVIENYIGNVDARYLRNCVTEVVVQEGASVELCRVQMEAKTAYHMASTHVRLERSSRFDATLVVLGSLLSRHEITYLLDGEGAEGILRGLYLLNGEQHVDHHTLIDHAQPNCQSKEFLNGVLDENSHAVFTGRILVREGAQKTDSKQSNNNMLLSKTARVDTQPQLEIYADDVRCTHGATLGPLDADSVFYLRARGISESEARRMLTYGFGVEIIEEIGIMGIKPKLEAMIRERLAGEA